MEAWPRCQDAPRHGEDGKTEITRDGSAGLPAERRNDKSSLSIVVAIFELLAMANSGMTVGEYDDRIRDWLAKQRHARFKRPYTDLVYKPMQELLAYLRANGFRTFIVSGGSSSA